MKISEIKIPSFEKILKLVSSAPADEVFTTDELAAKLGVGRTTVERSLKRMEGMGMALRTGTKIFYGSKKGIENVKKIYGIK